MQVTVGNQLRIENPSEQLLAWCKKQLILPNPEYAKKVRMHFWVGNTPEKLYLFQWDGDTLVLPYGCLNDVLAMDDCHMKVNLPTPTEVDFGCTMPPKLKTTLKRYLMSWVSTRHSGSAIRAFSTRC